MKKSSAKPRSKAVRPPIPELLGFLKPYDPTIQKLALDVRSYLLTIEPRATETIYDAYNAVAVGYSEQPLAEPRPPAPVDDLLVRK